MFDIFFAGVVSMAHCHPAHGRSNGFGMAPEQKTIEQCADIALEMIEVRRRVHDGSARDEWLERVAHEANLDR